MKKYFSRRNIFLNLVSLALLSMVATSTALASTTISTNIQTDGTLSVTGQSLFTGNVGIGTTSPTGKLEVVDGDVLVTNSTAMTGSLRIRGWNSAGTGINFDPQADGGNFYFGRDNTLSKLIIQSGNVGIGTTSPAATLGLQGSIGVNNKQLYLASNGAVGINTNGPLGALQVEGGSIYADAPRSDAVINGGAGSDWQKYSNLIGSAGLWGIRTGTNASINFDTNNAFSPITAFTILTGGNVGIGTTTPATKLQISSGASATTTITIGELGLSSSKACVNMNQADGSPGSFYIAGGVMKVESNYCR